jgi:hypothetical protein
MHHVPGENCHKIIAPSLEGLVAPEAFVRIIDAFVHAIDLVSFDFTCFQLNEERRPSYQGNV